ncbi:Outer membrane usher protein fimD precursor [Serratia fonticola]|uniref:fimbria/pilus outer membrane usher protein n=1 Tax=Serratia fonticola TaxID=47917 RepID=UPI00217C51CC|nr:fimbria/pilus outer membrane usher protein [Serratia fonticola]CAI1803682.1 Outer membrane usher protein fimD precursor [Serratia fonticola]
MKISSHCCTRFREGRLACFIASQFALPVFLITEVQARDYFNPALLELGTPGQTSVDLSTFGEQGGQIPGTYRVDIYLNNEKKVTRNVEFRMQPDAVGKPTLLPCLSIDDLTTWGVQTQKFPDLGPPGAACANLAAIPQANSNFRFTKLQLLLSVPQSAVNNAARGWVDPKQWDEGIPAVLLNYSISGANNYAREGNGDNSSSQFANLRPGANLGAWRLRNYTTWTRNSTGGNNGQATDKWNTVYTYVQRDIRALKSQLTLGDRSTSADVFDSIPFRGAQIASDDDMLPESLRGYAPIVRGIARTNAQVTIRQNGYVIYQSYVSPGSFEINDMYPTGSAGDLNVTIKESDGSEQRLVAPFASLPVLQREGQLKYSITSGVYRDYDNSVEKTPLTQGTFIYGLPNGFTGYGGSQSASKYQSLALGISNNLGDFGAISTDVTQAWSRQKGGNCENGQSWRVRYNKNFISTGTNFAVAGYRYATDGYWSMQEVLETYREGNGYPTQERRRNRAELTMTQSLWEGGGNLAITAVQEDYWNNDRRMKSYGVSYNNAFNGISYGISYIYNRNSTVTSMYGNSGSGRVYNNDRLVSLNLSIPINVLFGHPSYASYMMNTSKKGNTTHSVSLSGSALADNNLSWSVQEGYGTKGQGNSGSVNADWRATYGEVSGGYAYDKYHQRLNYGLQGGVVAHEDGITLSQPLGDTIALIAAPGANGVNVQGQAGVKTDYRGYTVVPYISPYRKNDITLNTETFGDDTEVNLTTQTVIPTRGAVVKASYQTSIGQRVLMVLTKQNGQAVPFGATVTVQGAKEAQGFIVGDSGQVYLTGLSNSGTLLVKWGLNLNEHCSTQYIVPGTGKAGGINNISGLCL